MTATIQDYIQELQTDLEDKETIVRFRIRNSGADTGVSVEPSGFGFTFETNAIYEIVGKVRKNQADILIDVSDDNVTVFGDYDLFAIFDEQGQLMGW